MKRATVAIDGAAKGNPGPAGVGIVIADETGNVLCEISEHIGIATNNLAEYTALIRGLEEALKLGFRDVEITTDSELLAKQIKGEYRVRSESITPLFSKALDLLSKFEHVSINQVSRERNKQADKLATMGAEASLQPRLTFDSAKPKKEAGSMIQRISVRTSARTEFVDITREVQDVVKSSGVSDGLCIVYVPHTTAGITINENADPDVVRDIIDTLERLVPRDARYRHIEGNADSHVKASLMGFSVSVFIENCRLALGTWQGIYFCEFDGPRSRNVLVQVIPGR
ncbi:MAG: secondary thiamine-phosphate synthase enzyme YjbQ [Armatimonadetes bacterium]|nr:secondary thiamine-phosphate synthase enzyme YjbQ [Armatimonadota bacterium]